MATRDLFLQSQTYCKGFLSYITKSVSPYHCVDESAKLLEANGFQQLHEKDSWASTLIRNGKYYVKRNNSSMAAFTIGGEYQYENGVKIIGAHTDSPNLQLKPIAPFTRNGYEGVSVQLYGGGLWHTWFDRDLGIAGKVIYRKKNNNTNSSTVYSKLIHIDEPLFRVPTLAIHLTDAEERSKGFAPHKENHIAPIFATSIIQSLFQQQQGAATEKENGVESKTKGAPAALPFALVRRIFASLGEDAAQCTLVDFHLNLVDATAPTFGGNEKEFIFSGRIDNLLSCYTAIDALIQSHATIGSDHMARVVLLFDHEEVGSSTAQGAQGSLLPDLLKRLQGLEKNGVCVQPWQSDCSSVRHHSDAYAVCIAKSFFISADGAHAVHANYSEKHHSSHSPKLHEGIVIKNNVNARYATTAVTASILREVACRANVPIQEFCVKNDSPCGSTIGPIVSSLTGIATVDIGAPMLSMHSIREMCATMDVFYLFKVLKVFLEEYDQIRIVEE